MSSDNLETEVSFKRDFGVRSAADHFTPRPTDREKKTLKTRCRPLKAKPSTLYYRSIQVMSYTFTISLIVPRSGQRRE